MKILKPLFLILFIIVSYWSIGQNIITNNCDSNYLTKEAFEQCKSDSIYKNDIITRTNYIIKLKTELLPKYRIIRSQLIVPQRLNDSLIAFKKNYDLALTNLINVIEKDMDRNQKFVQPKAYISTLLGLQLFKFYPDTYAVLLNQISLSTAKSIPEQLNANKILFDNLVNTIPKELYSQLQVIIKDFEVDRSKLSQSEFMRLFQGDISVTFRSTCNIVNFLLWTN